MKLPYIFWSADPDNTHMDCLDLSEEGGVVELRMPVRSWINFHFSGAFLAKHAAGGIMISTIDFGGREFEQEILMSLQVVKKSHQIITIFPRAEMRAVKVRIGEIEYLIKWK